MKSASSNRTHTNPTQERRTVPTDSDWQITASTDQQMDGRIFTAHPFYEAAAVAHGNANRYICGEIANSPASQRDGTDTYVKFLKFRRLKEQKKEGQKALRDLREIVEKRWEEEEYNATTKREKEEEAKANSEYEQKIADGWDPATPLSTKKRRKIRAEDRRKRYNRVQSKKSKERKKQQKADALDKLKDEQGRRKKARQMQKAKDMLGAEVTQTDAASNGSRKRKAPVAEDRADEVALKRVKEAPVERSAESTTADSDGLARVPGESRNAASGKSHVGANS